MSINLKSNGFVFTAESMLVVFFVVILASVVLATGSSYIIAAKRDAAMADTAAISAAVAQYELEIGTYPTSLNELTTEKGQYGPWLKEIPKDVFKNDSNYLYTSDKKGYVVYSVGNDQVSSSSLTDGIKGDDIGFCDIK